MKTYVYRQTSANMPENGFAKEGQSQGIMDNGKLPENKKWCRWSRRHYLFIFLVLATLLFFYNVNIKDMARDWSPKWQKKYNTIKLWIPFKSLGQNIVSPSTTLGPTPEPTVAVNTIMFMNKTNSPALPQTENVTSTTNVTGTTVTYWTANVKVVTEQTSQLTTVPTTPVPYVSPGPYLVEYPYEYHFIINEPQKCEQEKPFVVLMVPVAPHNRHNRDIIRRTWGGEGPVLGKVVKLFFLMGLHEAKGAEQQQNQLLQESKEHQDLIQSNFLDCYKNLTIKTMVMLEWLDSYCSSADYAMKIDSDIFLNVPNLIHLLSNAPKSNYMTGLVAKGAAVLRNANSKWYLPLEVYPHSTYPHYALGLGYVFSLDLPKKLMEASKHIKPLYIEDVFLGLCMQYLGISPTDPPDWSYFQVFPVMYSRCAYSKLIATTMQENVDPIWVWTDFKKPGKYC
ncbi:beta-1,3-galactosyltransferase 1 [Mastacembelus armatus]|uniref:Hexosyltransferase n=1 Tax=Mastacembelus armatus TaxID=205130 RepID=A0A3Q3MN97_9TELE|nr:beta-1,3-galactosyltransferase 1-like [Mastacembelus armatus]